MTLLHGGGTVIPTPLAVGFATPSFPNFRSYLFLEISGRRFLVSAKKKKSQSDPVLEPSLIEQDDDDGTQDDILFEDGIFFYLEITLVSLNITIFLL